MVISFKDAKEGMIVNTLCDGDIIIMDTSNGHKKVTVKFIITGYIAIFQWGHIVRGNIKDKMKPSVYNIGFIGDGIYKSEFNKKTTIQYQTWVDMLRRCYSNELLEKRPTYIGCTTCKEWYNFQNFAKWYDNNYPKDGLTYELDKDIKIDGNKVYSPNTCLFVSSNDNTVKSRAKHYNFVDINGVNIEVYNLTKFCKHNKLSRSHMHMLINGKIKEYKGWTKYYE